MNRKSREKMIALCFAAAAAVLLLAAGGVIAGLRFSHPSIDVSEGRKKLAELTQNDVQTVEAQIAEIEEAERMAEEAWQNRSYDEKFTNSLILGDSIANGLWEYEVLDSSLVVGKLGTGVYMPDQSGLTELLEKVVAAKPPILFIALGMNDVEATEGDAQLFADSYRAVLDQLKAELPATTIYVNSVLPMTPEAIARDSRYASVPACNEKLEALCQQEGVTFIDNTGLAAYELYDADGVHMKLGYYPLWLDHMAEVAGL